MQEWNINKSQANPKQVAQYQGKHISFNHNPVLQKQSEDIGVV